MGEIKTPLHHLCQGWIRIADAHLAVTAQYPAHSWLPVCHNATTNHNHWRASLGQRKPCPLHPNTAATFVLHAWLPALSTLKFRSPAVT